MLCCEHRRHRHTDVFTVCVRLSRLRSVGPRLSIACTLTHVHSNQQFLTSSLVVSLMLRAVARCLRDNRHQLCVYDVSRCL